MQVNQDVVRPGEHAAFDVRAGSTDGVCQAPSARTRKAIPPILNTKSLGRWYRKPFLEVTPSWEVPQVQKYDPAPFLSMRVFRQVSGTVLSNPHLWIEQAFLVLLYMVLTTVFVWWGDDNIIVTSSSAEKDVRDFCEKLSMMATFLLSFFTSLNVGRWWRLRCSGIGEVWASCSALCMFVCQHVTMDEQVLSAIRRYSRASLMLVFMKERGYADQLHILVERGLLTQEETMQMRQWDAALPESIWTWITHIIVMLDEVGLVKSEYQLVYLMQLVNQGRSGMAVVCAQLGAPVPMQYTHFIGLLVKVHNLSVSVLLSTVTAGAWGDPDKPLMFLNIIARVVALPLLYNCILLLNEEIMNPFSGDLMDFPMRKYDEAIEDDGKAYVNAGKHLPGWMKAWKTGFKDGSFDANAWAPKVSCVSEATTEEASPSGGGTPASWKGVTFEATPTSREFRTSTMGSS